MEQPTQQHKTNVNSNDEKSHLLSKLMLENSTDAQQISELVDALRKIGYFKSFQVTDNEELGSDKCEKPQERILKRHRKAAYRKVKKYYKSIKQYQKERLRRKLCWLLSGKYTESEIAEMLGCSRRTVIRDLNRIKPYYYRMMRSYFSKLEQQKIRELNLKLEGKNDVERLRILTDAIIQQRKIIQQHKYNRHTIKFFINLDTIQHNGFPQVKMWPSYSRDLMMPYIIKFVCIKDGEFYEINPQVTIQQVSGW